MGFDRALVQRLIHQFEHLAGRVFAGGPCADDAARQSAVEGGGCALSRNISDDDGEAAVVEGDPVVQVSAQFGYRLEQDGHRQRWNRRRVIGHQLMLDFLRDLHLTIHPPLIGRNTGIQLRIHERGSDAGRERHQEALMVFGEIVQFRTFEVDNADNFAFRCQRYNQLRAGF